MTTTTAKPPPASTLEARTGTWNWCARLNAGSSVVIAAASAAEGTPDAYAKAQEAVTYLELVASQARTARDSIPHPAGAPKDQFGWLENGVKDLVVAQREGWAAVKKEFVSLSGNMAVAVAEKMDAMRVRDASVIARAVVDEIAKMKMEKKA